MLFIAACFNEQGTDVNFNAKTVAFDDQSKQWNDYWYAGKAEINSYELDQIRYGQSRKGSAVLIFVTEPFSKDKQVKLDNPSLNPKDKVDVLKCNATRKFNTGIYPYSTMQSIFTTANQKEAKTLKVTTSSQEWCGHVFMQMNRTSKENSFNVEHFSYFESEGDKSFKVNNVITEDEIWNQIRINPDNLKTGTFNMLPGALFTRLKHTEFKPMKVSASFDKGKDEQGIMRYVVRYENSNRIFAVQFEKQFPFKILGWEETMSSGGKTMTTKARLKESIKLDYWNHNSNEDLRYRDQLGL